MATVIEKLNIKKKKLEDEILNTITKKIMEIPQNPDIKIKRINTFVIKLKDMKDNWTYLFYDFKACSQAIIGGLVVSKDKLAFINRVIEEKKFAGQDLNPEYIRLLKEKIYES